MDNTDQLNAELEQIKSGCFLAKDPGYILQLMMWGLMNNKITPSVFVLGCVKICDDAYNYNAPDLLDELSIEPPLIPDQPD